MKRVMPENRGIRERKARRAIDADANEAGGYMPGVLGWPAAVHRGVLGPVRPVFSREPNV